MTLQSSPVIQPDSSIPVQSKSSPPLSNDSSSIDFTNKLEGLLHQQREAKFKLQYWLEKAKEIDNQIEEFHRRKVQDLTERLRDAEKAARRAISSEVNAPWQLDMEICHEEDEEFI